VVRLPPRLRPMFPYLKPAYTRATRLVAPVTMRASQLRGGYLPTGVVETMEEATASTGGHCVVVRPAGTVTRTTIPRGFPDYGAVFEAERSESIPRVAIAELPSGRVLSPHSAVITGADDLLLEVSLYFGTKRAREHPIFLHPFPGLPLEVGGRLGVLALQGDSNYYHFMMDVVPRLGVFEQCPEISPPDLWYVPVRENFQRELLTLLGIDLDRCIDSTQIRHVHAECLVVPTPPAMTVINPPWAVAYLRRRLLPTPIERIDGRGIYVSRGGGSNNRQVTNEGELIELLGARGFRVIEPERMTVVEKIEAFAQASVIVGAHSAGLVNLAFASAGAAVVELFPSGGTNTCYWKLADAVPGLEYRYVCGKGDPAPISLSEFLVSDIVADLDSINTVLDDLGFRSS
jgi:Glycosyltransferase 61